MEEAHQLRQEERAWRLEQRMKGTVSTAPKVKVERYEDDAKREGRQAERVSLRFSVSGVMLIG